MLMVCPLTGNTEARVADARSHEERGFEAGLVLVAHHHEGEGDIAAQRQPTHVCLRDAEAAQQVVEVLDEVLVRIGIRLLEHARGRVAAMIVGDHPVPAGEVAHLGLPRAIVAAELVAPHERKAAAASS